MKIDYISDIHLNHYVRFKPNQEKWEKATKEWTKELLKSKVGDVLVIAGDFSEWNVQSIWFLEVCSAYYERVYFTIGNHDYYILSKNQRKKYGNSKKRVLEFIEGALHLKNVIALDGKVDVYNGVTFAGHSLWYNLDNPSSRLWYKENSNDSRYIHYREGYKECYELLYEEAIEWYLSIEGMSIDVFVSHVPPMDPPFNPYPSNACYVAPVPFLVGEHWISGHQHLKGEFIFDGTTFHFNAMGYPNEKGKKKLSTFEV